ncbi:hypothetical protein BH11BAC3_BH11BAC3_04330 [soil metagenome]
MKFELIINSIAFREILDEFVSAFLKEYGEEQLKDISQKVHSSNSVRKFLDETNIVKKRPRRDDFLGLIHSIYYFTFAKAEKIAFASTVALCKWQREVAIPNNIEDNNHLNETFFDILEKCKGFKLQISNSDNFFTKFYKIIEEKFSEVSLVENEIQNKLKNMSLDNEFILKLVIRRAFEDSRKSLLEEMYFSFDNFDYLNEDEKRKFNNQIFEISVIVMAVIGFVIEKNIEIKDKYYDLYRGFIGVKTGELSRDENHKQIFYKDEVYMFSEISSRINFYKKEIKGLLENQISKSPYGILYYFYLNPGNYSPYAEYTNLEEEQIKSSIENDDSVNEMNLVFSIKDIYKSILSRIV